MVPPAWLTQLPEFSLYDHAPLWLYSVSVAEPAATSVAVMYDSGAGSGDAWP